MERVFVGREAELERLGQALEAARAGVPQRVLVEGPAGVGKTALVRCLLAGSGVGRVLEAGGEEAEAGLAFGVLQQLLGVRERWPDALAGGAALVDAIGEAQEAGAENGGGEAGRASGVGGSAAAAAGGGVPGQVGGAPEPGPATGAEPGPVAVLLDDAQWADHPSLQALTFAVRRLRADRVLAILVVRDADDVALPAGTRRLWTADDTVRLRLTGLAPAELRGLSDRLGTLKTPLSARAATRLHRHTAGNPLHVRALLEQPAPDLLDDLEHPGAALPAPKSHTALVLGALQSVTPPAEALVSAAAVLGTHCELDVAAALADQPDPLPALGEAAAAGLLTERAGDPVVRFPHPLVHAAVYQRLTPSRRHHLHLRAAALAPGEPQALRHRARAATGPDPELAADLAALGRRRAATGDWSDAATHLGTAARLTADRARHEQLAIEALESGLLAGDVPDAGEAARRVQGFADSPWRSYLLGRLLLYDPQRAEALLRDAWHRADARAEPELAARVAGQFAALAGVELRGADMAEWADLALEIAPAATATDMIHYLGLSGRAMCGRATEALATLRDLPDPATANPTELEQLLGRGTLREVTGDLAGAVRDLTGVLAACHGRAASFRVVTATALASAEYQAGRWDDSLTHSDLARSLAADTDQPHIALYDHLLACLAHAARGDFAEAEQHLRTIEQYTVLGHAAPVRWAGLAGGYLGRARGDPEETAAALAPLCTPGDEGRYDEPGQVSWPDLLAEARAQLGDFTGAEQALVPYERIAADRRHPAALLAAGRARAVLAAARGDAPAAAAAFTAAHDHAPRVEAPLDRALLHLAHGQFLRRTGRRNRAAAELRSARDLLSRLGARPDLARCERELAACGQPTAPPNGATRTPAAELLTPQELAVARAVAGGLTNRQVARELVISVKTVEYHLGRLYPKLGVESRTQLATRLSTEA
ncbi:helix-turn-helix transcriptional regulator [Streptomyces boninensis]|uniref:helix-turn-helix transcriptional regulator n=1 Tax=Streptomyces boninensis TaxID=2039455 RepID=UPI003B21ED7E